MSIAAVSLDAHRTLFHAPRLAEIYATVLRRHGVEVEDGALQTMIPEVWRELSCRRRLGEDRFRSHPGGAKGFWHDFVDRLCDRLEVTRPGPFAAAELYDRFARGDAWVVYPEVDAVLGTLLERGVRLALVSNFDQRLPRILAELGLAEPFEVVVYSAGTGVEKPHPAIFEEMLHRLDLPATAVVHVGDSVPDDVEGALALGMGALWLARERDDGDLSSLDELPDRVAPTALEPLW